MSDYRLERITPSDEHMGEVITLGDRARRTIGLLPRAAFFEAARKGGLLAALQTDEVVAYALYGLPRNEITLTHLVVREDHKKRGLARALVEKIIELYPERSGIRASCREDYGLGEMWSAIGFYPRSEKIGRGADRAKVIVWYRPNPTHADLFTGNFQPLIKAALDFNILRDLCDKPKRESAHESLTLIEDHLLEKLQLLATPQLFREVSKSPNASRRRLYLSSLDQAYLKPNFDRQLADSFNNALRRGVVEQSLPLRIRNTFSEHVRYLAEAAACGADVFVTQDDDLISTYGPVSDSALGLRIMRPSDVVVKIDELSRSEVYRPSDVEGTSFRSAKVTASDHAELSIFQNSADHESSSDFLKTLRAARLHPSHWNRTLVRDSEDRPVLLTVSGAVADRFQIPLFRVDGRHPVSPTLVQHALFEFRRECRENGLTEVVITDRHLPSQIRRAALLDGFMQVNDSLVALVVDVIGPASDVLSAAGHATARAGLKVNFDVRVGLSRFATAEIERILWPAKIVDSEIPNFILSIKPTFSSMLFGFPTPLPLFRKDELGLGREHVYYRTPGGLQLSAPARLLWYKSQGREKSEAAVFACSLLEEVEVDSPQVLHSKFSRLGVWNLQDIERAAKNGKAQALRFTRTEIFRRPIAGKRLKEAFARDRFAGNVQAPRNVTPTLFASIYHEGTRADNNP
ncbi:GNAT family N-acetyltransferase [Actinomadura monticuli]|uniref:GNAT family N-acetyltransferase n=1 Tax=Actinomadura monticuli TaxID=3097367 RepID=A0ABV4Q9N8_9ACTN